MLVDIFITPCICIRICKLVYPAAGEAEGGGEGGTLFNGLYGAAPAERVHAFSINGSDKTTQNTKEQK